MEINEFTNEILDLINTKREGDYWDFKEEPHDNNAELLHDILCLSNSLHKGYRYLIYGVTDPKEGAYIKGLNSEQQSRKTQVQFIDFLRSKAFAGDYRPEIELHTIIINNKEIDILVIFDNPSKPYYLKEEYSKKSDKKEKIVVRANHVYTRTNDTNTPIDKSADIGIIEKMWKQRFGLDLNPLARMKLLLIKPNEWFKDIGNKSYAYHLEFPEFRIEFSEVNEFEEVFSFFFTNHKSYLGTATFKYHSTTLFELEYMFCDEMRIELAVPKIECIKIEKENNWYYYYVLDELNGLFLRFLTDNLSNLKSRFSGFPFVLFDNNNMQVDFNEFVRSNKKELGGIESSSQAKNAKEQLSKNKLNYPINPIFIDKITQMFKQWSTTSIVV